jgi:hypothetical protein
MEHPDGVSRLSWCIGEILTTRLAGVKNVLCAGPKLRYFLFLGLRVEEVGFVAAEQLYRVLDTEFVEIDAALPPFWLSSTALRFLLVAGVT